MSSAFSYTATISRFEHLYIYTWECGAESAWRALEEVEGELRLEKASAAEVQGRKGNGSIGGGRKGRGLDSFPCEWAVRLSSADKGRPSRRWDSQLHLRSRDRSQR